MIDFLKLGQYSVFSVEVADEIKYHVFTHVTDDGQVYGWTFNSKKDALKNMADRTDSYEQILMIDDGEVIDYFGEDCDNIICKVVKRSTNAPKIYVGFEFRYLKSIMKRNIIICYDYMDQGFCGINRDDDEYIYENFFEEDGTATMFTGEGLWIDKEDYLKIVHK